MIVDGIDFPAFIRKASPNLHHAHDSGIGKGASATAAPVPADVPLFGQGGLSEAVPNRPRKRRERSHALLITLQWIPGRRPIDDEIAGVEADSDPFERFSPFAVLDATSLAAEEMKDASERPFVSSTTGDDLRELRLSGPALLLWTGHTRTLRRGRDLRRCRSMEDAIPGIEDARDVREDFKRLVGPDLVELALLVDPFPREFRQDAVDELLDLGVLPGFKGCVLLELRGNGRVVKLLRTEIDRSFRLADLDHPLETGIHQNVDISGALLARGGAFPSIAPRRLWRIAQAFRRGRRSEQALSDLDDGPLPVLDADIDGRSHRGVRRPRDGTPKTLCDDAARYLAGIQGAPGLIENRFGESEQAHVSSSGVSFDGQMLPESTTPVTQNLNRRSELLG